jgi:hypothetical protein
MEHTYDKYEERERHGVFRLLLPYGTITIYLLRKLYDLIFIDID